MKILLLTCSTGEGHNSAARALERSLSERGIDCEIADPLDFRNEKAAKRAATLYARTIKYTPQLFGAVYAAGKFYDALRLPNPVYRYNARCAAKLNDYIVKNEIDCVICTHLFAMHSVTAARRKFALSVPLYGVLTDYTAIPFYKETALDGYFVSHDDVKRQLERAGIPSDRIFCTGIPVNPALSVEEDGNSVRDRLNIPRDKNVIAVLSGGAGCGKILKLCRALQKSADPQTEIYVFPAKNIKLQNKLKEKFCDCGNVKIIPFTNNMSDYLKSANLALSKAGGLTTSEIATAETPLVILKSIPGCETANRKYFCKNGLAVYARTSRRAVREAQRLLKDSDAQETMRKKQSELVARDACEKITDIILNGRI